MTYRVYPDHHIKTWGGWGRGNAIPFRMEKKFMNRRKFIKKKLTYDKIMRLRHI